MCCPNYADERTVFIQCLKEFSSVDFTPDIDLFNTIMHCNNGDTEYCKAICLFGNSCFEKRNSSPAVTGLN